MTNNTPTVSGASNAAHQAAKAALDTLDADQHITLTIGQPDADADQPDQFTDSPIPADAEWDDAQDEQTDDPDAAVADGGQELVCKHDGCTASFDNQQGLSTHQSQWCDHKPGNDPVTCECGREFDTEHARSIHQGKASCDAQDDETDADTDADADAHADAQQEAVADGGAMAQPADSAAIPFTPETQWKPAPTKFERVLAAAGTLEDPIGISDIKEHETIDFSYATVRTAVNLMAGDKWLRTHSDGTYTRLDEFWQQHHILTERGERVKRPVKQ